MKYALAQNNMDELPVCAGCAYNFDYVICCGKAGIQIIEQVKFIFYKIKKLSIFN
jgi:hypothetical protein